MDQSIERSSAISALGIPVQICVVCYGDNAGLARRFAESLYRHTHVRHFHLHAGLNEVCRETLETFMSLAERHGNVTMHQEERNVFKCPLMRRIFSGSALSNPWVIWCDDDTHFTRPDWLLRLALRASAQPDVAAWGQGYALWRTDDFILDWIRAASWYRSIPFMRGVDQHGCPASEFHFPTGGFWAAKSSVIQALDWPDPRLIQANDDFLFGEALRQNGFRMGNFDYGVKINDSPRRNPDAPEVQRLDQGM